MQGSALANGFCDSGASVKRHCWPLLLAAILLMPSNVRTQSSLRPEVQPQAKLPAEAEAWVRSTLQQMTLEEKLGQLIMIACYGGFVSTESAEFQRLARLVEGNHRRRAQDLHPAATRFPRDTDGDRVAAG